MKHGIVPLGVPYNLNFTRLKSAYNNGIKSADVMGVVHTTFTSFFPVSDF